MRAPSALPVLIAEHHRDTRKSLSLLLSRWGFDCKTDDDGLEGLTAAASSTNRTEKDCTPMITLSVLLFAKPAKELDRGNEPITHDHIAHPPLPLRPPPPPTPPPVHPLQPHTLSPTL